VVRKIRAASETSASVTTATASNCTPTGTSHPNQVSMRRTGRSYAGPEPGQPWGEWLRADAQRMFDALIATRDAPRVVAGNRPSPESLPDIERALGVLVDAGRTPGDAQQTLFAIGAYVIGGATEWQAEAERSRAQPLPDPTDEALNRMRAEVLSGRPLLLEAIHERLGRSSSSSFRFGLDLLVDGLRARNGTA
jgi:TetR/AcrR family transcriptional regulator, tetracycline repressor protein